MTEKFKSIPEFFPTPVELMGEMFSKIDMKNVHYVLEPSAGKGNLARFCQILAYLSTDRDYRRIVYDRIDKMSAIKEDKFDGKVLSELSSLAADYYKDYEAGKRVSYCDNSNSFDIDCIEKDENLRLVLKGKNLRVVDNDFLDFYTEKKYDLIIMNPPFSNGEEHLLKALSLQERFGGQICCILNAETIKNPYSNKRKLLVSKLQKYHAEIEYIDKSFCSAERKTNVSVAIIWVNIPSKTNYHSTILDELQKAPELKLDGQEKYQQLITDDVITASVIQYREEIRAGKRLMEEYLALKPLLASTFEEEGKKLPLLRLTMGSNSNYSYRYDDVDYNKYVKAVRYKYWYELLHNAKFIGNLTSNLKNEYFSQIQKFADFDYTLGNIYRLKVDILKQMVKGVEDKILELFEQFTYKHSCECEGNVHYFNGWKTNKAFIINKKVVVPWMRTWDDIFKKFRYSYDLNNFLSDVEKTLKFLDNSPSEFHRDISHWLSFYEKQQQTKKLEFDYFTVNVYKKGTIHITFTNDELLKKLNIYGCQKKGWLPPVYGKKHYSDMTDEEKSVIDEFEGEQTYEKMMENPNHYISSGSSFLALPENTEVA